MRRNARSDCEDKLYKLVLNALYNRFREFEDGGKLHRLVADGSEFGAQQFCHCTARRVCSVGSIWFLLSGYFFCFPAAIAASEPDGR